jgi:hypothetical protein
VILCTALYTGWSIAERIHERLRDASHHIDELLAPITANNQPDIDELAARRNATGRRKEKL